MLVLIGMFGGGGVSLSFRVMLRRTGLGRLVTWNIEDIQYAACCWLSGGRLSWVVGHMVPIDDVVIPVSLSRLKSRALKSERSFPPA